MKVRISERLNAIAGDIPVEDVAEIGDAYYEADDDAKER